MRDLCYCGHCEIEHLNDVDMEQPNKAWLEDMGEMIETALTERRMRTPVHSGCPEKVVKF